MNSSHFLKVLCLLSCFIFIRCSQSEPPTPFNPAPQTTDQSTTITYLALGDSYTIGQSVTTNERWPEQLKALLEADDIFVSNINYIAQTGWTSGNLISAIKQQEPIKHDLVSLLIGVNNQYQGRDFQEFKIEFDTLVNISQRQLKEEDYFFVVSIPDYGVTPFGQDNAETIAEELDAYNSYMQTYCSSRNIPFINITDISRSIGEVEGALASDNLHPGPYQYELWAEAIFPIVRAFFN